MPDSRPLTILCLASYEKGQDFIKECKRQGHKVILLTLETLHDRPWPMEYIDERFLMPRLDDRNELFNAVSYLARTREIDRVVPLDDYDVEQAAALREHLRCPGMGESTARFFRDKLAMRVQARDEGVLVPEFVPVLNYERLREFMARVPGPWVLKPRSEAAAVGIRRIHQADHIWPILEQLGDRQSHFLLEKYIPGNVYHVDAITYERKVLIAELHRYGAPPLDTAHDGGIFTSRTLPRDSVDWQELEKLHAQVMKALRFVRGVTHSEFIKGEDGQFYFLETSARVGGAFLVNMVEASTGLNMWVEWARIEIDGGKRAYRLPERRYEYSGLILSLARQEWPDTVAYADPEVIWRAQKRHHAGLVLCARDPGRIETLLDQYSARFRTDFYASAPPLDRPAI